MNKSKTLVLNNFKNFFTLKNFIIIIIFIALILFINSISVYLYAAFIKFQKLFYGDSKNKNNKKKKYNYKRLKKLVSYIFNFGDQIPLKNIIIAKLFILVIYLIIIFGFIKFLNINMAIFITILGTLGLSLGLSLQTTFSTYISSFIIAFNKKFEIGDYIESDMLKGNGFNNNILGKVVDFNFINTKIKENGTDRIIFLNNNKLYNSTLINYHTNLSHIYKLKIMISENKDLDKIYQLIEKVIIDNKYLFVHSLEKPYSIYFYNQNTVNNCNLSFIVSIPIKIQDYPNNINQLNKKIILSLSKNGYKTNCLSC